MYFRADKSHSIVIARGKSMNTTLFYITEPSTPSDFTNYTPSIHSVPVKFLGRIINGSLTDRNSIGELHQKLVLGLNIDLKLVLGLNIGLNLTLIGQVSKAPKNFGYYNTS